MEHASSLLISPDMNTQTTQFLYCMYFLSLTECFLDCDIVLRHMYNVTIQETTGRGHLSSNKLKFSILHQV